MCGFIIVAGTLLLGYGLSQRQSDFLLIASAMPQLIALLAAMVIALGSRWFTSRSERNAAWPSTETLCPTDLAIRAPRILRKVNQHLDGDDPPIRMSELRRLASCNDSSTFGTLEWCCSRSAELARLCSSSSHCVVSTTGCSESVTDAGGMPAHAAQCEGPAQTPARTGRTSAQGRRPQLRLPVRSDKRHTPCVRPAVAVSERIRARELARPEVIGSVTRNRRGSTRSSP